MPLINVIMLYLKCKFFSWLTASDVAVYVRVYEGSLVVPIARYINGRLIPPDPAPDVPDIVPPDWTGGQASTPAE